MLFFVPPSEEKPMKNPLDSFQIQLPNIYQKSNWADDKKLEMYIKNNMLGVILIVI